MHHRCYVEWMNFMSHDSNHNVSKYMPVLSKNIYCLQMFNFDGQEDDQAAYDLILHGGHKFRWAFSRGNCNS